MRAEKEREERAIMRQKRRVNRREEYSRVFKRREEYIFEKSTFKRRENKQREENKRTEENRREQKRMEEE